MNMREMLSSKQVTSLHIMFGRSSEIGVLKEVGWLSVGISFSGTDLRKYKELLRIFTKRGGLLVQQTPKVSIQGRVRRAALLRFDKKSHLLGALLELKKNTNPAEFRVGPTEPTIVWSRVNVEDAKTR